MSAAVSVYLFHDVDKDQAGHLNEAFAGLCTEVVLYTLIIGGGVELLSLLGRLVFRLKGYSPRPKLSFFLGIGVTVLQYPWDYLARAAFPNLAGYSLSLYLILAIVLCSIILVRDSFKQMKLSTTPAELFDRGSPMT